MKDLKYLQDQNLKDLKNQKDLKVQKDLIRNLAKMLYAMSLSNIMIVLLTCNVYSERDKTRLEPFWGGGQMLSEAR